MKTSLGPKNGRSRAGVSDAQRPSVDRSVRHHTPMADIVARAKSVAGRAVTHQEVLAGQRANAEQFRPGSAGDDADPYGTIRKARDAELEARKRATPKRR